MMQGSSLASDPITRCTPAAVQLCFDRGTLLVRGLPRHIGAASQSLLWDPRVGAHRAPAYRRPQVVAELRSAGLRLAEGLGGLARRAVLLRQPQLRSYQQQALSAWQLAGRRGVVVLPTGAGKTRVAIAAIAQVGCATLVLVPTRVLLAQWLDQLKPLYDGRIGVFGDGTKQLEALTLCTFESAYRHMDRFGDQFALVVVDEVHHFGAGVRVEALEMCTAPARLGLTATPAEGAEAATRTADLVGAVVCAYAIADLSGNHLAPFDVIRLYVDLGAGDAAAYARARQTFLVAHRQYRCSGGAPDWATFVREASQTRAGREALRAFHESRRIVSVARAKSDLVARLIGEHRHEPVLVFTADNAAAYGLSRRLLVPALTCDIARREREAVLQRLREGRLRVVISARVLNEGVDLPAVRVGIIAGGTLGSREHKQRVGRLLRPGEGKRAVVYEVVARDTHEVGAADRRQRSLVS